MEIEFSNVLNWISFVPQYLTNQTTNLLVSQGINATTRWTSNLYLLISLILVYIGIKVSKPIIKFLIIFLAVILFLGLTTFW